MVQLPLMVICEMNVVLYYYDYGITYKYAQRNNVVLSRHQNIILLMNDVQRRNIVALQATKLFHTTQVTSITRTYI